MAVPPPSTTVMPSLATCTGAETRERHQAWEATGQVPKPALVTTSVVVEATSPRTMRALVGLIVGQGGLGRSCHFKMIW